MGTQKQPNGCGLGCGGTCPLCDPAAAQAQSLQNYFSQAMNNVRQTSMLNALNNGQVLGGISGAGAANMFGQGYANGMALEDFDVYVRAMRGTRNNVMVTKVSDAEADVATFLLGEQPSATKYEGAACYLNIDDLPENYKTAVALLQAAFTGEEIVGAVVALQGVGSVRLLSGGMLYFRVFTLGV